ncbi:hypothetical protein E1B28_000183 [Marasmius oreades]|uniref:Pyranose 2-oxidase n=1 Tax=Marasmius oreades TaxID=181124 RepID=A0A9P7V0R1_9AGAR|nr:uncharacterized protein E1B28_000183 [Marasmius oreades]KAG7098215.1 hypothetical protein E1B28_000183 [Marasmius oreades]
MSYRLSNDHIHKDLQGRSSYDADVIIAGSGPVGMAYARTILEKSPSATVLMIEIGSQDDPVVGEHHKNSIKFQKDIDAFVNVIKGALQSVSVPPADTYIPTLVGDSWTPPVNKDGSSSLIFQGSNPNQIREKNLKASAMTRTVGGMATHWTCACPTPHPEEIVNNPIPKAERDELYVQARKLLNVHNDQYDKNAKGDDISIRHNVVKKTLLDNLPQERNVQSLPLGVERRRDNPAYVTWTGANTVLGDQAKLLGTKRFTLKTETRVTRLVPDEIDPKKINGMLLRNLKNDKDELVTARAYVITCGAIGTPQILANSNLAGSIPALGRHLCEQSIAFCQIVMKNEIIDYIKKNPDWQARIKAHHDKHPKDPLPIPFADPEPQVMVPYTSKFPWHTQIHRDAFSYGDVGPRADARVVVDLRFFGRQEVLEKNRVYFAGDSSLKGEWVAGSTDIYGMPQATFEVERSQKDKINDQRMMKDMCEVASLLGAYLPGSNPQFMDPGLALHITGTTRIGKDPNSSVADPSSCVHAFKNLWVGGNGCIPDSMGANPTLTSVMIALKGAGAILDFLKTES